MVNWVKRAAFPGILGGGVALTAWLAASGLGEFAAVVASTFLASVILLGLQRWIPYETAWRGRPRDFGLDLLHAATTGLAGEVWRALVFGFAVQASLLLSGVFGSALWPTHWPVVVQLGLALVVGDLGVYALHRAFHAHPALWRVHAMHHSSERMYVFAASRSHPLNFILAWGAAALPLVVLGCPDRVLLLVGAFTAIHGMLQHANVDFRHGVFNRIFATADLHRWHHSTELHESHSNFGSNLVLWDVIFQTRYLPDDRRGPQTVGIRGLAMPENWFSHLASPVLLGRWTLSDLEELDDFTLEATADGGTAPGAEARTEPAEPTPLHIPLHPDPV